MYAHYKFQTQHHRQHTALEEHPGDHRCIMYQGRSEPGRFPSNCLQEQEGQVNQHTVSNKGTSSTNKGHREGVSYKTCKQVERTGEESCQDNMTLEGQMYTLSTPELHHRMIPIMKARGAARIIMRVRKITPQSES